MGEHRTLLSQSAARTVKATTRARNALERQEVRCYDHDAPTRKAIHLRESDRSPGDAPADLPLRDEVSAEAPLFPRESSPLPPPRPPRPMFDAGRHDEEIEPPIGPGETGLSHRASGGVSTWLVAAASLIVGILIGFASGYTAAQPDEPSAAIAEPDLSAAPEPPASSRSTQTFTEDNVDRVDPDPIVVGEPSPAPAPAPRAAAPVPPAPPASQSARPSARREPPTAPRREAPAVAPRTPPVETLAAEGSGSMEVVSRPAGAQVVLDGLVIGKTPMVLAEVPSGSHSVRLELPGFQRWATAVNVNPGQRTRVAASLEH